MSATFDVAVVGLGAVGSWALHAASAQGLRVLGLEQYELGHANGSSHGGARVTRSAYFEHPDYVPLIRWSTQQLHTLQKSEGVELINRCGALLLGPPESRLLQLSAASAQQFGIETEEISPRSLAERFPQFSLPSEYTGLLEPGAGFLRVETSLDTARSAARRAGAQILDQTTVVGVTSTANGIVLATSEGELNARVVIVAAGPWTTALFPQLKRWLRVTRQVQGWLKPASPGSRSITPDTFPCWLIDRPKHAPLYGIPDDPLDLAHGSKIAIHGDGVIVTPSTVSRRVSAEERGDLQELANHWLYPTGAVLDSTNVCMYTSTSDGHFVVEATPDDPRIVAVAGLSGHGFKMAPALGYASVELALYGRSSLPVEFLSRQNRQPFPDPAHLAE